MAKEMIEVEKVNVDDHIANNGDERNWFYLKKNEWLRRRDTSVERYESFGVTTVLLCMSLFICAILFILALINGLMTSTVAWTFFSFFLLLAAAYALWIARLQREDRARVAAIPAGVREWNERLVTLLRRIEGFNSRLSAFKLYASNAEPGQQVDPAVVEKYVAEGEELRTLKRQLLRDHALTEFEQAAAGDDTGYRETRDLSDAIFVNRVRIEGTGRAPLDVDASADVERFRALEEKEQRAASVSSETTEPDRQKGAA